MIGHVEPMLHCRYFVTQNARVWPHLDRTDGGGSWIVWSHGGADLDGGFCLYSYLLRLRPRKTTLLYMDSNELWHGSEPPSAPGLSDARLGMALVNKPGDFTTAHHWLAGGGLRTWKLPYGAQVIREPEDEFETSNSDSWVFRKL